jgi:hypothetical protein
MAIPSEDSAIRTDPRNVGSGRTGAWWSRLAVGFVAGFLSVAIVTSGLIEILHAAGVVPGPGWNFAAVPPFGVPQTVSFAFWGGVWGIVYVLLEPRLSRHLGWALGGIVFGAVLPLSVGLFIVPALKAMPIGPGLVPSMLALMAFLHGVFGLSIAVFFRIGQRALHATSPSHATRHV